MRSVSSRRNRVTWAQAFRDLGLRVFTSGRFVPLLAFILLFSAIVKAPSNKMPEIIKTLAERSVVWTFMGWIVAAILLVISIVFFVMMRRVYLDEIDRVKKERDELQEKLINQAVQHSKFKGGNA
jgi:formate hydrogenlyase subunit 4